MMFILSYGFILADYGHHTYRPAKARYETRTTRQPEPPRGVASQDNRECRGTAVSSTGGGRVGVKRFLDVLPTLPPPSSGLDQD